MSKQGLSPEEFFKLIDEQEFTYNELSKFNDSDMQMYGELLDKLKDIHSKQSSTKRVVKEETTTAKGKALEEIVTFLLLRSGLFKVHKNIRNSTNEIDQLIELSFRGKFFERILPFKGPLLLSECKNYNKKIDVTWVGKFHSLLASNSTQYGFIFSYHGLTGKNWEDAVGLTKKLFLLKEDINKRIFIIDFNIRDFNLIFEGHTFLNLINAKINALITDTNFEKFLTEIHPALEIE